jgi:hypothetical protein
MKRMQQQQAQQQAQQAQQAHAMEQQQAHAAMQQAQAQLQQRMTMQRHPGIGSMQTAPNGGGMVCAWGQADRRRCMLSPLHVRLSACPPAAGVRLLDRAHCLWPCGWAPSRPAPANHAAGAARHAHAPPGRR